LHKFYGVYFLGGTMTQLFITSDEHIGHARIIDLANRPFTSLDEMKQTIVTNHNKKVPDSRGVLTVHVGDWLWHNMTLQEAIDYINLLHGRHAFMFGNHDELVERNRYHFRSTLDFVVGENKAGGAKIFNCDKMHVTADHFARRVWQGSHKGLAWYIYQAIQPTISGYSHLRSR